MPYLVHWSERGTASWGESTVETIEEVRGYLKDQGYTEHTIEEAIKDGSYFSTFDVVTVVQVPKQKQAFIVCDPNGILKVRQIIRKDSDLKPILICRNKAIAEGVITTARKLGQTRYRLPLAHKVASLNNAIGEWLRDVHNYSVKHLNLGDVKPIEETNTNAK